MRTIPVALLVLALLASAANAAAAAGDARAGQAVFASKCASCHQVGPSARAAFGPPLTGIVGRPAASQPGYAYSPALQRSGITWNDASLAAFLKAPDEVVPGTKMRFYFLPFNRDRQIADLLAYLREAR